MICKLAFQTGILLLTVFNVFAQKSEQMNWMAGTWKINTGNGIIQEDWRILNDSTLTGRSVFIRNGTDTIPQESIELSFRNGDWYYTPTVATQNEGRAIPFKVIYIKGTEFISENPEHDFPQRIAYRRIKTQLFASLEGKKNAKFAKMNFDFSSE